MSIINITKNSVQHSITNHIEVRHHFIRYHIEKGNIILEFVPSHLQLTDVFTTPLGEDQFNFIRNKIAMLKRDA